MKWNCNNCEREIISDKKNDLCLECWWESQIEKTEINLETIRKFVRQYLFIDFNFDKGEYVQIETEFEDLGYGRTQYHTKNKVVKFKKIEWWGKTRINSNYLVFLEKLFRFAKKEGIERINIEYEMETIGEFVFKVLELTIEKKLAKNLEKEK